MIDYVCGTLVSVSPARVVVEAGGIGYAIHAPLPVCRRVGSVGRKVKLLTHLVVREDAHLLYGFLSEEERALFRTLIGVKGVGAATAMQILSSATPEEFALAVERQDSTFLKRIKGIGEKSAKRIILELKGAKTLLPAGETPVAAMGMAGDAVAALVTMGIPEREALTRVEQVLGKHPEIALEELVKRALQ